MNAMTVDEILNFCLTKPGAYVDFPFGEIPVCVKVGKRLFAQLYPHEDDFKITLNCDMMTGGVLPQPVPRYSGAGVSLPTRTAALFQYGLFKWQYPRCGVENDDRPVVFDSRQKTVQEGSAGIIK